MKQLVNYITRGNCQQNRLLYTLVLLCCLDASSRHFKSAHDKGSQVDAKKGKGSQMGAKRSSHVSMHTSGSHLSTHLGHGIPSGSLKVRQTVALPCVRI